MFGKKRNLFDGQAEARSLDINEMKNIEGGKTSSATLTLHVTVPERVQTVTTATGYAVQSNIPGAKITTTDGSDGTRINISAS